MYLGIYIFFILPLLPSVCNTSINECHTRGYTKGHNESHLQRTGGPLQVRGGWLL